MNKIARVFAIFLLIGSFLFIPILIAEEHADQIKKRVEGSPKESQAILLEVVKRQIEEVDRHLTEIKELEETLKEAQAEQDGQIKWVVPVAMSAGIGFYAGGKLVKLAKRGIKDGGYGPAPAIVWMIGKTGRIGALSGASVGAYSLYMSQRTKFELEKKLVESRMGYQKSKDRLDIIEDGLLGKNNKTAE